MRFMFAEIRYIIILLCNSDSMEAKLPLLWSHALYLACRQCEFSSDSTAGPLTLRRLIQSVTQTVEHKSSWNILGAIGLGSNQTSSNRLVVGVYNFSL